MALQLRFGRVPSTFKRDEQINPIANFFKTKDDRWICLSPRAGGDWDLPQVARAIGREEWLEDERFNNHHGRRSNSTEFVKAMDEAFSQLTLEEWGEKLDKEDLIWAPVQNLSEVANDKQAIEAGSFVEIEDPECEEKYLSLASPVKFHDSDVGPKGPAPLLGEHNKEILSEMGYSIEEINKLEENGIIGKG
jgi:Predicted acyl-CoA transferases/carnitine dehydratase